MADLKLASDFAAATEQDWLALAQKALKSDRGLEKITSKTLDGIERKPLYSRADAPATGEMAGPGQEPFARGTQTPDTRRGWDIRQRHAGPDPDRANTAILADLSGGVSSLTLQIAAPGQFGLPARYEAIAGVLEGVHLDMIWVGVEAGDDYMGAAHSLQALWAERGIDEGRCLGGYQGDPLGVLARNGVVDDGIDQSIQTLAHFTSANHARTPNVTFALADGRPYHNGGASEAEELATCIASLVTYLRAFESEGVNLTNALRVTPLAVAADADQFLTIAKIRALRHLVWRIAEAAGRGDAARTMHITAETSTRMLSAREPYVNMLRNTLATAGAALAGADAISVLPFTWALGQADAFAQRMARNTQTILMEESGLDRVTDPLGGSWYLDRVTQELALKAWEIFQEIEAQGGMDFALKAGMVQDRIAATAERRAKMVAQGEMDIVGATAFADVATAPLEVVAHPPVGELRSAPTLKALQTKRDTAPFEALRARADARARSGERPAIALICLGERRTFAPREGFMINLAGAGGIATETVENITTAEDAIARIGELEHKPGVACLCADDETYGRLAAEVARKAKAAGLKKLLLAGRPGDLEDGYRDAGIDDFIHARPDRLEVLEDMLDALGA